MTIEEEIRKHAQLQRIKDDMKFYCLCFNQKEDVIRNLRHTIDELEKEI